ncbi:MAG: hypothetical protein ABIN25_10545 [Ginsengibacter sp.]
MKKALLFAATILFSLCFLSCKKNKNETVAEKLQHKWLIENTIENYHDASGDDITTTPGTSADFVDFNANGTYTSHSDGYDDNGIYSVVNDTQLSIDGDTITIKTLTDKKLVLYSKFDYSTTDYDEFTINLKR